MILALALPSLLTVERARAADGTWTNPASGGLWSDTANWSSGIVADGSGFSANFGTIDITASTVIVHLDSSRTLTGLTFADTVTSTAAGWLLDNNGSSSNVLTLAGTTPTITVNGLGTGKMATISAAISGSAGLTKSGAGTLALTGTNNYTGMTIVNNGVLDVGTISNGSLGTGGIFLGNLGAGTIGILQGNGTLTRTLSASSTPGTGQIAGQQGGFAARGGTLTVDFGSQLIMNGAGFAFGNNLVFGSATADSKVVLMNNINVNSGSQRLITVNSGVGGDYAELSGVISSSGGLGMDGGIIKAGTGLLLLSAANTYSGEASVNAGTLQLGNAKALGTGGFTASTGAGGVSGTTNGVGGTLIASGATLDLNGQTDVNEVITISGTGVGGNGALVNNSGTAASIGNGVAAIITTAGANATAPTITLSGGGGSGATANATRGVTSASFTINGGTTVYSVAPTVSIGGGNGDATATAILTGGVVTGVNITYRGTGYSSAPTLTFSGGTVTTAGTNPTATGNASNFITDIQVTNSGTGYTSAPTVTFGSGTGNAATAYLSSVVLAANASAGGSGDLTINGVVSGAFTLTKVGAGTLTLAAANTYSGGTTFSAGTVALANAGALGTSGTLTFSGGTLQFSASNTTDYSARFSTSASQAYKLDTNGQTVTLATALTSSSGTLTKSGTGTLILTNAETFTGVTTVSNGTLQLGNGGAAGSIASTSVTGSAGATLAFNRSAALTYSGAISGGMGVLQMGAGTITLNSSTAHTYTGPTTVNAGVLSLDFTSLATPTNLMSSSSALQLGGGTLNIKGKASNTTAQTFNGTTINAGANALTVTQNSATAVNVTLGTLTRNTGGLLDFTLPTTGSVSTANSNDAGGLLGAGITVGGNNWATVSGGNVVAFSGYTTQNAMGSWAANQNLTNSAALTGSLGASLSINTLRLNANAGVTANLNGNTLTVVDGILVTSTVSSQTQTISNGTLRGSAGGDLVIINNGAAASTPTNVAISAAIADNGTATGLTKGGGGFVTLSGTNTYTGATQVAAGTLQFTKELSLYNNTPASWTAANLTVYGGATATFNVGGTGEFTAADIDILKALGTATGGFKSGSILGLDTTNAAGGNFAYSGNITDTNGGANALGLTKTGTGFLTLTGSNTYTGTTTVLNGVLDVGTLSAGSLGSGGLILGSLTANTIGIIQGNGTFTRSLSSSATVTTGQVASQQGGFAARGGTLTVNFGGAGATISFNTSLYIFGTNFVFGSATADSKVVVVNGINLNSGQGGTRTFTVNSGVGGDSAELAGVITSNANSLNAGLLKQGTGLLLLSAANTYAGVTQINAGTVQIGNAKALGTGGYVSAGTNNPGTVVAAGATLDLNGQINVNEVITLSGTGVGGNGALVNNSATAASIGNGVAALTITNAGANASAPTVTFSGGGGTGATANASLGITAATFTITNGGSGYTSAPTVSISGGGGDGNASATATIVGGVVTSITIVNAGNGFTSAPTISFSGGGGSGAAATGNAANFAANIQVTNSGTGYTSAPTVSFGSGTGNAATALLSSVVLSTASSVGGSGDLTINAVVSGTGTLTKVGAGTLTLTGANTNTGATTLSAGVVSVGTIGNGGVAGNLGQATNAAANLVFDGGTLQYTGATSSTDRNFTINAAKTAVIEVTTNNLTMSGSSAATTGSLTKAGAGVLTLTGTHLYSGATVVSGGTLELGNGSAGGTIANTSGFNLSSTTANLKINHSDNVTLGQAITGSGNLQQAGTGTTVLTNAGNAYTGTTTVSSGILQVGNGGVGVTGTGAVNVTGGQVTGSGVIQGSSFTLGSGATLRPGDSTADSSQGTLTFTPVSTGTYDIQSGSNVVLSLFTATVTDPTFGGNVVGSAGYNAYINAVSGTGNHDQLVFNGTVGSTLNFSGNLIVVGNGFTPQVGQVFNLVDWATTFGTTFDSAFSPGGFQDGLADNGSQFDLPDLSGYGLAWDTSNFTTSGNIAVVTPEPGRALLSLMGLGMMMMMRRRRRVK